MAAGASCGDIWGQEMDAFQMARGAAVVQGDLSDLLQALAAPGRPFRIGGAGPVLAGPGEFETLTSGSLGQPRHIRRTMASWTASFAVNAELFGIGPGVRVAVLGGMEQSLALYGAVEALHLGADLSALGAVRPDRQRRLLHDSGTEVIYAAPAQLRRLVEAGGTGLPDLRVIVIGGSKLDDGLRAALGTIAPKAQIYEFYGAAETSFVSLAVPGDPSASVGQAYPRVQIEIRNAEAGVGEVWVRSPFVFAGYSGADAGGARWQDGWLWAGDMGWMEGTYLYLSGRAGRMVTVADQNVFPEEIEAFLQSLPGVRRAAVLPRPDALRGVHLVAHLMGDRAQEAAIMRALRAHLGPLKAPKALIWRQDWPCLASGKTDLRALDQEAAP